MTENEFKNMTPSQLVEAYEDQKAYVFNLSWTDSFYYNHGGMQAEDNVLQAIAEAYQEKTGHSIREKHQCN